MGERDGDGGLRPGRVNMSFTELTGKYFEEHDEVYQDAISTARRVAIRDFAHWLDSRRPSPRAADQTEQSGALCICFRNLNGTIVTPEERCPVHSPRSNRSVGG